MTEVGQVPERLGCFEWDPLTSETVRQLRTPVVI